LLKRNCQRGKGWQGKASQAPGLFKGHDECLGFSKGYGEYLQQSAGLLSDGQRGSKHISSALPGMVKELQP
jgi:hypothetical protein